MLKRLKSVEYKDISIYIIYSYPYEQPSVCIKTTPDQM